MTIKVLWQKSFFQENKSWKKNVSKYVVNKVWTKKLSNLFCVTGHMWHVTSDITTDTLQMGVGEHGVNFHVSSCKDLRLNIFKRYLTNCWIFVVY